MAKTKTITTGTTAWLYSPTSTPNTIFCSNAADWLRRHKTVLCQEVIVNTRVHNLQINETQIKLAKILQITLAESNLNGEDKNDDESHSSAYSLCLTTILVCFTPPSYKNYCSPLKILRGGKGVSTIRERNL